MRHSTWKAVVIGMFCIGASAAGAHAQEAGCTNATLKGNYAFTVSGQIFATTPAGPATIQRDGIAMTYFDGEGNLTQEDFVLSSPNAPAPASPPSSDPVTGFHDNETGKYKVFPDCTGTFTINTPATSPTITVKFVLSNGGNSIHTIVNSLTLPGASEPTPALIHSEGRRLGRIREWWE